MNWSSNIKVRTRSWFMDEALSREGQRLSNSKVAKKRIAEITHRRQLPLSIWLAIGRLLWIPRPFLNRMLM